MIQTAKISHQYSSAGSSIAMPDVNLKQGEEVLIIGKSGCGKTTLLHILGGLLKPNKGEISIMDNSIYNLKGSKLDQFRGKNIGIVFQTPHFINSFSVIDNLLMAQKLSGLNKDLNRINEVLSSVGLADKVKSRVFELSQGEKQRITIARAVINHPKLILADEPTSSLDDKSCSDVINLLRKSAKEENATLIIVTHDQRLKDMFHQIIEF